MRVFAFEQGQQAQGKVVLVPQEGLWVDFLALLTRKFAPLQVTRVFLQLEGNKTLEIEDINELHEGDTILVQGIKQQDEHNTQLVTAEKKANNLHPNDVVEVLGLLATQLGRMATHLETHTQQGVHNHHHMFMID